MASKAHAVGLVHLRAEVAPGDQRRDQARVQLEQELAIDRAGGRLEDQRGQPLLEQLELLARLGQGHGAPRRAQDHVLVARARGDLAVERGGLGALAALEQQRGQLEVDAEGARVQSRATRYSSMASSTRCISA